MIQAGGDLYVGGRRGDRPWRLGIRDPRGPADRSFATLDLSDGTFSTSGDYERFFIKDGGRYHHILDPSTGRAGARLPQRHDRRRQRVLADGLSTGVFLLGPEAGMALIERLPDVEGGDRDARQTRCWSRPGLKEHASVAAVRRRPTRHSRSASRC